MKVTTQKIHSVMQSATGELSSKYAPSEKIDRKGYDLSTFFKGMYVITPDYSRNQTADDVVSILASEGIKSETFKDVVKVKRVQ